eukprot:XP_011681978.1 PREDICTED: E3 ubiquitin-protein ligase Midline-1-like [Strongylocentrotus purpuratus]
MAEKTEEDKAPSSSQNLTCPLCLDIFDKATILTSCGHTFCRKCLENYDLSHKDLDHMTCPLCREVTKLSANRVKDFLTNVTVNALVDDYHAKSGGMNAVLEMRPKCTTCKRQEEAVSFCKTCNSYLCKKCLTGHQNMSLMFEAHEIVSVQDIINGKVSICHLSEKCYIHKQENKDMFCEDCKVHVCLKCVIVGHQFHKIKNQADFEQELRLKVSDLVQRCAAKKTELEKNIQNVEVQRREVYTAVQKLLDDISQAYSIKVKELEENHRHLTEQLIAVKQSFEDDLNVLKSKDRQSIKSICSSMTLVANDRLGRLETDSLSAHTLLCEELDAMLKEATDHTSAAAITKKAQEKRFNPADDSRLDLGSISESATDHTSAAAITKKAQEKRFNPAGDTRLDLGSISGPDPKVQVIQYVDLRGEMRGMTQYSDDSVAIGYLNEHGIDIIDLTGKQEQYANIPSNMECYDLVFQQDRSLCISTSGLVVTSSGSRTNPGVVTVYDRYGNAGKPLRAPNGVLLYAAVDEQDGVYIASVDSKNGNVVIRLYDLDGLNLKERVEFNVLNLTRGDTWCYLVSLCPNMLAFARNKTLYFIKLLL